MFRAIGRYFRALGYLLTGRIDEARRVMSLSPHVVRATYDQVVEEKAGRIRHYRDAVAGLIANVERKKAALRQLTEEVGKLEQLKAGALAMAKKRADALTRAGKTTAEIQQDQEYLKCRAAFNDFSSTLEEKAKRIAELETDITEAEKRIGEHKIQLQGLLRDLEKIREEREEAVADVITAREEQEIADMLTGISADGTARDLQEMRELRQRAKAGARIAREMAGTDTRVQEAQFLEEARKSAASDEFDRLTGVAAAAEAGASVAASPAKTELPS